MNLSTMGTPTKSEIPTEKVACDLCGADAPKVVYRHGKAPGGKDWTYEDIVAGSDHFDAVALVDVIEHVPSPKTVLKEVARVLKPGGAVYLVTPDMKSLTSRLMGRYWWALRPGHIFYFDAGTLKRTLEAAGFEVVHTSSYGRIFTLGYWYSRLNTYPAVLRVPVGWFVRIFGLDTKFTFINTRDSIEVVARKK
jgi:SAM-dependent methyltransferase